MAFEYPVSSDALLAVIYAGVASMLPKAESVSSEDIIAALNLRKMVIYGSILAV